MKRTHIEMGPVYFQDGQRSIYLKENTYIHIEQLDANLQIYDVSFSKQNFTVCRVDDGSSIEERPWNNKRMLWMHQTDYNVYDNERQLLAILRGSSDQKLNIEIIEVS